MRLVDKARQKALAQNMKDKIAGDRRRNEMLKQAALEASRVLETTISKDIMTPVYTVGMVPKEEYTPHNFDFELEGLSFRISYEHRGNGYYWILYLQHGTWSDITKPRPRWEEITRLTDILKYVG